MNITFLPRGYSIACPGQVTTKDITQTVTLEQRFIKQFERSLQCKTHMKARAAITKKCILVWPIERVIQGGKIVLQ